MDETARQLESASSSESALRDVAHARQRIAEIMLELVRGRSMHADDVDKLSAEIVSIMCAIVSRIDHVAFVPHGYSSAQACANRVTTLGTIPIIFYDDDNCQTKEELLELVEEMRECALDVILARPSLWFRGSGVPLSLGKDAKRALLADSASTDMVPVLGCDDRADADWKEILVEIDVDVDDADEEAVACDSHRFVAIELAKSSIQYLDVARGRAFDAAVELYETSCPERLVSRNSPERRLSDDEYAARSSRFDRVAREILSACDEKLKDRYLMTPSMLSRAIFSCCKAAAEALRDDEKELDGKQDEWYDGR